MAKLRVIAISFENWRSFSRLS